MKTLKLYNNKRITVGQVLVSKENNLDILFIKIKKISKENENIFVIYESLEISKDYYYEVKIQHQSNEVMYDIDYFLHFEKSNHRTFNKYMTILNTLTHVLNEK